MPEVQKHVDIVFLSGLHDLGALGTVLEVFEALIQRHTEPSFAAIGELGETDNHFGPVLKLERKNGRTLSVRIPWQYIQGVASGVDREADVKALGFALAIRAKKA